MKPWLRLFFILPVVIISGCRQEKSFTPEPVTIVSEPFAGQFVGFSDTLSVKAEITHIQPITYVEVAMINEYATPVLPVQTFYPAANQYSLATFLVIDNYLLESGAYSVRIKTVIEGDVFNKWVRINYTAEPKRLESLLVLTKKQASVFSISDVLPGGQSQVRFSFSGDYTGSALSSETQLFYTAGKVLTSLSAWNLVNNRVQWSVPTVPAPPLPYFTSVYTDGSEVYVSTRDALVLGYAGSGTNTFRSKLFSNGYFTSMIRYKTWLMAVFEPFNSQFSELVAFSYPGGTVFRSLMFQGNVAGLADYGDDGVLLFINDETGSSVFRYSFDLNNLIKLKDFPQGRIAGLIMPDALNAYLATDDGIYWYRPDIASSVKVLPDTEVSDLAFDPLSGTLFVASGKTVSQYQLPSFSLLETYPLPDSLLDIHLLYNR